MIAPSHLSLALPGRPCRSAWARWSFALAVLALLAWTGAAHAKGPLVILDPGHTAKLPGAMSVRGRTEVDYNDAFVALLASKLTAAGFEVALTRKPGEELTLGARAKKVNERKPWLLLSIHHDSAQLVYLHEEKQGGATVYRTTRPIRGYSLFISGSNASHARSVDVAKALGRKILALGRPPTLHHEEPIPGEGRPLLDRKLGIYRYDDLKVLKQVTCPAVLLEVGVLVDEADEAYVSDPVHQEAIAGAIVDALVELRGK